MSSAQGGLSAGAIFGASGLWLVGGDGLQPQRLAALGQLVGVAASSPTLYAVRDNHIPPSDLMPFLPPAGMKDRFIGLAFSIVLNLGFCDVRCVGCFR